jgi:hypothetical protein
VVLNDNANALTRARLHAIELLLAQIIAERLSGQADAAASAASILVKLMATADRMPLSDTHAAEDARVRDDIKYTVFEVLNTAVNHVA